MRKWKKAVCIALFFAAAATGCAKEKAPAEAPTQQAEAKTEATSAAPETTPAATESQTEKAEEPKAATHTVTDVLGREVEMKNDIERVVVTFNLEEFLAVTGEEGIDKLVGFSHSYWKGRREDAWKTYTEKYPQLLEVQDVGYNDGISVETILSLQPDLVVMSSAVNHSFIEPQLDKFEEAGIPILFVNYHAQTLDMHRQSTEALGQAMNQEKRAKEIADFYEKEMKLIEERIASLPADAERPTVYMEFSRGVNEYGNSWGKKMWGALIGTCGGTNIAYDLGEGNSVDVSPELVLAADPDLILFTASPQTDISDNVVLGYGADKEAAEQALLAYENRNGWSELSAVKNRRMGAVYHDLSRHIFDFAGAQFLAKMIQPELFEDMDPGENLEEFFELYMPVELDGAWLVTLGGE